MSYWPIYEKVYVSKVGNFNRIRKIGLDNLTVFQKEKVQKATLLQAQYYSDYGIDNG